jgi:hypothetical protein
MASILNATTSSGLVTSADNSGSLQLATNNGTTAVTIDTSQNLGIGTATPTARLDVTGSSFATANVNFARRTDDTTVSTAVTWSSSDGNYMVRNSGGALTFNSGNTIGSSVGTERMRINSTGWLLVGTSSTSETTNGLRWYPGAGSNTESNLFITNERNDTGGESVIVNRQNTDGTLIQFRQANTVEGNISVSGSTVSYNGGHLSRYAQTLTAKDDSLLKGTVLSNLDEMNIYVDSESNAVENEQLNKVKVSDVEGDVNVAGVFVNWSHDESHDVDEINMAMTGDMIIRIAQGVTVQRGDLLMSAGDGTAKPQGDDIVRSKTIAKVTSSHVTCTYEDGSYCVPCVLMAC